MVSCGQQSSPLGAALRPDERAPACRAWRLPDEVWEPLEPVLPARTPHPVGCHRPRVEARQALAALVFVRRTGCPWGTREATGIGVPRAAHRRIARPREGLDSTDVQSQSGTDTNSLTTA
jgi:hypothetical protein